MAGPVVTVKQGSLRGVEIESDVGGSFISFKGIPYAEPPVGNLRFKDAQPPKPWTGIRDALEEGPQCIQLDEFSNEIEGDDDCLYLNVSTTSLAGSRPVMVWIHGGAFMWGNGGCNFYGPDYLVKKDIVFVGMNYRLGVLGFLSLDHEALPGNMGLKDQVAALKWVKENIAQFGGDPNNVTIFGESAGSASVHYHIISPLSKGLFHKAIAQSGVVLNPWARAYKHVEIAHRLVACLGAEITDPYEIVEYLRSVPAKQLGEAQKDLLTAKEKGLPFAPTLDDKSTEPFLPRSVKELVAEGHDVPFLLGYNSHEGSIGLLGLTDEADQELYAVLSRDLPNLHASKLPEAVMKIRKFYFGDKPITKDRRMEYMQCIGDSHFVNGIHQVVDIRKDSKSPTYLYKFSHNKAPKSLTKVLFKVDIEGTGHADDIVYLFHPHRLRDTVWIEAGSTEQIISERFLRMWTNFAKTGNPTPHLDDSITVKWEPVTSTKKNYLAIGAQLSVGVNPDQEMWELWKQIHDMANSQ